MRVLLENEAYVQFDKLAKAKGKTARELATELLSNWLTKAKQ